ncbi:MAG: hypothetical protein HQL60_08425, partial [Magnetococcales bacterium]|nr:hypothetical protein [Magnetococcales bacterium]
MFDANQLRWVPDQVGGEQWFLRVFGGGCLVFGRWLLFVGVVLGGIGAWVSFFDTPRAPVPQPPLRLAFDQWAGYGHAFIAQQQGLFTKNGVSVQLNLTPGPGDTLNQYRHHQTDAFFSVFSSLIPLWAS